MFAVCSSIEYDLRQFIQESETTIEISEQLVNKAKTRNKKGTILPSFDNHNLKLLEELDLGDLHSIITTNHAFFKLNLQSKEKLDEIFLKIIPIRNRVMHSRPLEFADRSILEDALKQLDKTIQAIPWRQLKDTRLKILENPSQLLMDIQTDRDDDYITTGVYHNLPLPEFDDTGFVGRRKDINELTELLLNRKSQIITIVGNGGFGKTALAIKCLYDIIDDPGSSDRFDAIIWVSLKTKSLTSGEFTNIKNAVKTSEEMYNSIHNSMINDSGDSKKDIITFMENFRTLLVIDNLETLATEDVIQFLKDIPDNSKVLITSRNGVGELETRYKLSPLDTNDSQTYFRLLCQYYGLELYKRDANELKKLLKDDLYSSPLSIKWFVTSISFGAHEETLISNKDKMIEFSMSNIVERLTEQQKEILHLFLVQGLPLGYGEIDFYLATKHNIASDINVLLTTSMLELKSSKYQINKMAKEYLSLYDPPKNSFVQEINIKRNSLNQILQSIQLNKEASPFTPTNLFAFLEDSSKKIAAYYLNKALMFSKNKKWDLAYDLINRAQEISPGYFEIYKIRGFINAENQNLYEAMDSYRIAVESAETKFHKATVYFAFSKFYKDKMSDAESAYEMISKAEDNEPDNRDILLEKARILIYLVRYQEAEDTLQHIKPTLSDTDKYKNIYASRYADLCIRKGQQYSKRDFLRQFDLIQQAIDIIEELETIDRGTTSILAKALADLAHLGFHPEAKLLFERKFIQHFSIIVNNTNKAINKLKTTILDRSKFYDIEIIDLAERLGVDFKTAARKIKNKQEGIIVTLKERFGFLANSHGDFYFNINDIRYMNCMVGDRVIFTPNSYADRNSAKNINLFIDNNDN